MFNDFAVINCYIRMIIDLRWLRTGSRAIPFHRGASYQ